MKGGRDQEAGMIERGRAEEVGTAAQTITVLGRLHPSRVLDLVTRRLTGAADGSTISGSRSIPPPSGLYGDQRLPSSRFFSNVSKACILYVTAPAFPAFGHTVSGVRGAFFTSC